MTYDAYRYIFIGAAVLSGVLLIAAVLVFIVMNIPKVISDLTGATARKAIKEIREQNEAGGQKTYKASAYNEARGKLTDKISPSGNVIQQRNSMQHFVATTKIETQELLQDGANETTVLGGANETTVLGGANETTVLGGANETTVLNNFGETSVLNEGVNSAAPDFNATERIAELYTKTAEMGVTGDLGATAVAVDPVFAIEYDITYIHTDEIIVAEAWR